MKLEKIRSRDSNLSLTLVIYKDGYKTPDRSQYQWAKTEGSEYKTSPSYNSMAMSQETKMKTKTNKKKNGNVEMALVAPAPGLEFKSITST